MVRHHNPSHKTLGLGFGAAKDYKAEAVDNFMKLSISPSATLLLRSPLGVTSEESTYKSQLIHKK